VAYGLLLLRVVAGSTMAGHGSQKMFGAFGGSGLRGTAAGFASLRFRAPLFFALAAACSELGGGLLLALGLVTPVAAAAIVVVMTNAVATVHGRNGFWNEKGGFELNLLLATVAVGLAATGPGRFSLDRWLHWDDNLSGLWWALAAFGAALLVSLLTLTLGRSRAQRPAARLREAA
jgi:putative oxidoreductase